MRMFVALTPPPNVVEGLATFLEPRRDSESNLRWTDDFQWHVTLAFLGDVPVRKLDDLVERIGRAAARRTPFSTRVAGSGAFPSAAHAKVLWLGVAADPTTELERLAAGVRSAAVKAGVEVSGGRFRPHLTMARVRHAVDVTRWLGILDSYEGPSWTAVEIQLIESHLGQGPGGRPRYEEVGTFAFRVVPDRHAPSDMT
jgi:RNA 2',3'-cyclic 3'-phosphodiesterase